MAHLADLAFDGASREGWFPPKGATYRVDLNLYLPTMRGDIDGPVKRIVDATFQGLRKAYDHPWVNDGRVVSLSVEKWTHNDRPGLAIFVGYL